MGDIVAATEKLRGGTTTIQCPMLTATNYTVCAMRMKITLKVHKAWEAVETEDLNSDKNNMVLTLFFQ